MPARYHARDCSEPSFLTGFSEPESYAYVDKAER